MTTVEDGLRSQLRNIELSSGRSVAEWMAVIRESGAMRHGEIVAMLKTEHGLAHGAAHRLALVFLDAPAASTADPVDALYEGRPQARAIHDSVWAVIAGFGDDIVVAPKKGYLSLRRRTQFAMLKPAAKHLDVALVRPDAQPTIRFESAATFNALFTHRVRVRSIEEVDDELAVWIRKAYELAR
jgi:hypothetical protein